MKRVRPRRSTRPVPSRPKNGRYLARAAKQGYSAGLALSHENNHRRNAGTLLIVFRESLTIAGWVAMWRPM
jgi:hypothetical protein